MLINNITDLRKWAKVNANLPFETIAPYLQTAEYIIIADYIGEELLSEIADTSTTPHPLLYGTLRNKVCGALAPLALFAGIGELSVRMSDAGFTVEKKENLYVPASDVKLTMLRQDLLHRGMQLLGDTLSYLSRHVADFPSWKSSAYYIRTMGSAFIRSAREYQDVGMVQIHYNYFIFDEMLPLLRMIEERYLSDRIPFLATLRDAPLAEPALAVKERLVLLIKRFTAMKSAELYTSELTRNAGQHNHYQELDFRLVTRPLFGSGQSLNFYADNATYYLDKIDQLLEENATLLGIDEPQKRLYWNNADRKLFTDIG